MERTRVFTFPGDDGSISINLPEIADPSYGMYVWPSAPVLAQYILGNKHLVHGRNVLEIGAGTSLPGIMAAKCGANVTLSDSYQYSKCLENCVKSCTANCLDEVRIIEVSWGQFSPDLLKITPPDIIIGSDCFYDTKVEWVSPFRQQRVNKVRLREVVVSVRRLRARKVWGDSPFVRWMASQMQGPSSL